jgi:TolB-like protein/predicted Zn-dependent protease
VLSIKLLGGFEAHFQSGESIPPIGRKAQALLATLAMAPGTPQPREKLAALLWSNRGEAQARSSLRQALSELRKALAAADPPPLETAGESVTLAADAVVVDVDVFGRLIDGGERPSLESAAELYRGDLLDGLAAPDPAFEDWLRDARQRLRDRAREALSRLMELQRADGEAEAALATARRLVALDPLQESAHRAIMRLHAALGERTLALKQYQACRDLLRDELGVEPDRETERLHEEIKQDAQGGSETPAEPAPPEKPAIAVLPFDNLSDDPEQAYFADGMTRALITELGRLPNLAVVAAASTFAYEGRRVAVAEVSRDLGARYVVEGGIQKSGRRFRVTAQMTDAETGRQIWGDRFDGDLGDIFEIQDELTKQICGHLYLPLLEHRYFTARQKPTASADGLLMWIHIHEAWNAWVEDPAPALQAARRDAERGVAIANTDAYLRGSLGFVEVLQGDIEGGLEHLRSAVDLIPGDPAYRALYGGALSFAGKTDEAFAVLAETERLSPGYHVTRLFEGDARFVMGRPAEAVPFFEQFLTVLPDFSYARLYVAACQVELGQAEAARETVAKIAESSPDMTASYVRKLLRARDSALVARLLDALGTVGLPEGEAAG